MPTNNFKVFAGGGGADVVSQAAYESLSALTNGFTTGTAVSGQLNKVWRQSSIMAAVLAQFIADQTGSNAVDDGTTATLEANLILAIRASLTGSNIAFLNQVQTFTKAQRSTVTALTDGATINVDFSLSNDFSVTLGGNRTLTFTNAVAGQSGTILVSQDGTGSRTMAYTGFKFYNGAAPVLTTTASAVDHLHYKIGVGNLVTLSLGRDSR